MYLLLSIAPKLYPSLAPPKHPCCLNTITCCIFCIVKIRVVSGEPVARPPVVSLCCGVARRVVDRFGPGVTGSQAKGVAEALVTRLDRGIDGERATRENRRKQTSLYSTEGEFGMVLHIMNKYRARYFLPDFIFCSETAFCAEVRNNGFIQAFFSLDFFFFFHMTRPQTRKYFSNDHHRTDLFFFSDEYP